MEPELLGLLEPDPQVSYRDRGSQFPVTVAAVEAVLVAGFHH